MNGHLTSLTVSHAGPGLAKHTITFTPIPAYKTRMPCPCGHIWAVVNEDGSVSFDGDLAYFPITVLDVNNASALFSPVGIDIDKGEQ